MDIREMILERIEFGEDFTLIAETSKALDLMKEYLEEGNIEYFEEGVDECDVVAISLVNGGLYVEDAFYGDEVKYMETDTFIIDKVIVDEIDLHRLEGNIVVMDMELEDIEEEYLVNNEYEEEICACFDEESEIAYSIENITNMAIEELEDSECEWCSVEKAVRRGYKLGYDMALRMMKGAIDEILED